MTQPFHAVPGTLVEFDGEHYLVEAVRVEIAMQRIDSRRRENYDMLDFAVNEMPVYNPVIMRVCDEIGGETLSRIIPLVPMEPSK